MAYDGNDEDGFLSDFDDDDADVIFEGQGDTRKTRIYRLGNYYYRRDSKVVSTGTQYYRCTEFRRHDCRARATSKIGSLELSDDNVKVKDHNHSGNPRYGKFLEKRRELIKRCLGETCQGSSLKKIFLAFVKDEVEKSIQPYSEFNKIKRAVEYRRRKAMQNAQCPRTFQQVHELFENPDFEYLGRTKDDKANLYQGMVGSDGEETLVFASQRLLKCVKKRDILAADQTFKITPRLLGALQVAIVAFFPHGTVYPVAFGVMQTKTTEAYAAFYAKLKELGLNAKIVVTDWEQAEREAWRRSFPGVEVWGCIWHFIRCLFRRAKKCGLQNHWTFWEKSDEDNASLMLRLSCLIPRLPGAYIAEEFQYLKEVYEDVTPLSLKIKCLKYLDYFERQWVRGKTVLQLDELSVHNRSVYATSGLEAVNRQLNTDIGDGRPQFFRFLRHIKAVEDATRWKFKNTKFNKMQDPNLSTKSATATVKFDEDIIKAKSIFIKTRNVRDFLTWCQPSLRHDFAALDLTPGDDPIDLDREDIGASGDDDGGDDDGGDDDSGDGVSTDEDSRDEDSGDKDSTDEDSGDKDSTDEDSGYREEGLDMEESGGHGEGQEARDMGESGDRGEQVGSSESDQKRAEKRRRRQQRIKDQRSKRKQLANGSRPKIQRQKEKKKERSKALKKQKRQKEREATKNTSRMRLRKLSCRRAALVEAIRKE